MAPSDPASVSLYSFALGNSILGLFLLSSVHDLLGQLWANWWILIFITWSVLIYYNAYKVFQAMGVYQVIIRKLIDVFIQSAGHRFSQVVCCWKTLCVLVLDDLFGLS